MRTSNARSNVLAVAVALLALGCGSVTPSFDAAVVFDGPTGDAPSAVDAPVDTASADDAAADAAVDAPVDAGIDGPSCVWITVSPCDSGGTIAQFCPVGTRVADLRRCDGTTFAPDQAYQRFHLCNCQFQTCGCSGVAWSEVQCCN